MCSSTSSVPYEQSKRVSIVMESKQVMLTALEGGWNTFIFPSRRRELATGGLVIREENKVAAFQGHQKTVFAISKTPSEAKVFLEALEHGLGEIVLKVEDVEAVLELKEYFDRRSEGSSLLCLTKAIVTRVQAVGLGDRVYIDLCYLMKPGEELLEERLVISQS